jgi:DNA processing protein
MGRDELAAWLRLLLTPGVGNDTGRKLLAAFGSPEAVWDQSPSSLKAVTSPRIAEALQQPPEAWMPPSTS